MKRGEKRILDKHKLQENRVMLYDKMSGKQNFS